MRSSGNEELSQILHLGGKDRSQYVGEHPVAAVRTKVTFCTVHERETSSSCFFHELFHLIPIKDLWVGVNNIPIVQMKKHSASVTCRTSDGASF